MRNILRKDRVHYITFFTYHAINLSSYSPYSWKIVKHIRKQERRIKMSVINASYEILTGDGDNGKVLQTTHVIK